MSEIRDSILILPDLGVLSANILLCIYRKAGPGEEGVGIKMPFIARGERAKLLDDSPSFTENYSIPSLVKAEGA